MSDPGMLAGPSSHPEVTNQQCGEALIKHVEKILYQQGKGIDQTLKVTRCIVDNYETDGRLNYLYQKIGEKNLAWIGQCVTHALSKLSKSSHSPLPAEQRTKSAPPCHFFLKGACKNGAACRFSHSTGKKRSLEESLANAVREAAEDGRDSEAAAWAMAAAATGGATAIAPPEPKRAKAAAAKLSVDKYKRGILVRGETHQVKQVLKCCGLTWNRTLSGWIGSWAQRKRIIAHLRACSEVELTVTFDDSAEQAPPLEGFCNVCRDRPARMVLMPCGHQCCCSVCVPGLNGKCPICRASFECAQKVYMAGAY